MDSLELNLTLVAIDFESNFNNFRFQVLALILIQGHLSHHEFHLILEHQNVLQGILGLPHVLH